MSDMEKLIQGLNEDLAAEWGTIMRYTYQSAKSFGVVGAEIREMLEREIPDEMGHARYLTDVIVDLDGEPTTEPAKFDKPSGIREMLELDLKKENQDVENYRHHAELADEIGHIELKVKLEEIASDEQRHAREINPYKKDYK